MSGKNPFGSMEKHFAPLILFFLFSVLPAGAQKYFFDSYGVKQGLSEQKVYSLLQDSRDYIWLGTANGLSRFDGKTFVNFTSRDNLASGGVKSITEDSLGFIWFGHLNGGISRYNGQSFEHAAFDSLKITSDVTSITQIGDKIWFTSRFDGAIMADFPAKDIRHLKAKQYRGKNGLSDQVYWSKVKKDGSFICVTDAGLKKYNGEENKFEIFRMPHMTTYFSTTCFLEDSRGNLWFGTWQGGMYKYIMSESRMVFYDLIKQGFTSNTVACLTEDRKGRIWAGTWGGGIALFEGDNIRKFDKSNGLKASRIYSIIEDIEGNILIADQDNGLTIYKGEAFLTVNEKELLPDPNVNAIYQDKSGSIWFGTNNGISRLFPGSDKKPVIYTEAGDGIFENVKFFREDRNGNLWIGANDGGVIMYNMKYSRFESQPLINIKLPIISQVTALEIDRQNNLWIGTVDGVVRGSIDTLNFNRYTTMDSLTVTNITSLYCDAKGIMWIGTEPAGTKTGLIRFDPSKNDFSPVSAFSGIMPKTIVMDRQGVLWIGTGEGLISFRNDTIISTLTKDDGLLSDNINLVAIGKDGSIYVGTNNGLNRYFPDSRSVFSYNERNGFTGIETKSNSVFETAAGDLWFGTANGATRLTPEKTETTGLDPLTHILGMQVNYKTREMIPGMKLSSGERSVLFDYYSICLTNPDIVRYKVRLEGADENWRPVTDQTRAIYSALPPGKYTFMVVARNSQGMWNKTPVTFPFVIEPPFYLTWWFILIMGLLVILVVFLYIKIRERNLITEKVLLEEKIRIRTAEVVQKSKEIEDKNRDITASIRYAERIQRAMLQREDMIAETFVLFMPKDIVSGDFYWMFDNSEWRFIAAIDCTGHGVPGAFMSIIGHNSLNKIVTEYELTKPSEIVDQLNVEVMNALLQRHEKAINDGMDLALIAFDKKQFTLDYAGAYNPLYVVRKGELFEYKPDRFPVGMATLDEKKRFTNNSVDIRPGDMLYMCSDGYADQFGHVNGKKYKSGNVKKLLVRLWDLPVYKQKEMLEKELLDWKGDLGQVDDILFIGTRIPEN